MKNFRGTLIFAIVVAAVAGYTYWDYQNSQKEEQKKADAEKLVPLKDTDVVSIYLKKQDETLEVVNKDGKWTITQPVQDAGDAGSILAYIDAMKEEKGQLIKSPPVQWQDYFLDQPASELVLKTKNGDEFKIQMGANAAFDGQHFLRIGDNVYLGSATWARHMSKPASQLRDKTVYRVDQDPQSLEISNRSKDLSAVVKLERSGPNWKVSGLDENRIDAEKVRKWVDDFRQLKADDFAPESKTDKKAITKYKLNQPERTVKIGDYELKVGPAVDGFHYAVTNQTDAIFKLGTAGADNLQVTANHFRTTKGILAFSKDDVGHIEVNTDKANVKLKKAEKGSWSIDGQAEGKKVAQNKVTDLMDKMANLEVKDFPKSAKGLAAPKGKIRLAKTDGSLILELIWGDEYAVPYGPNKAQNLFYAKSSLEADFIGLSSFDIKQLPVGDLVEVVPVSEKK